MEPLSKEICKQFQERAKQISNCADVGAFRELRIELQNRCGVTEIQAINILNGRHVSEYINQYRMAQESLSLNKVDREYIEWLEEKEAQEQDCIDEFEFEEDD